MPETQQYDFPVRTIKHLLQYGGERLGSLKQQIDDWIRSLEDGKPLDVHHAVAVAKCIGAALGLITGDEWIEARLVSYALIIYDILKDAARWYVEKDPTKRAEKLEELKKEVLRKCFPRFEKIVEENGGHFGGKLTWLDFFFFDAALMLEFYLDINIIDGKYPALGALATKIHQLTETGKKSNSTPV